MTELTGTWRGTHCVRFPTKLCYPFREEAISAAARTWLRISQKVLPYQCGDHWHIGKVNEGPA